MMMEAARTSETSVDNYFTQQYIPEDNSELHTRRRENLKSHNNSIRLLTCMTTAIKPITAKQRNSIIQFNSLFINVPT
jgi:hypothetical protein